MILFRYVCVIVLVLSLYAGFIIKPASARRFQKGQQAVKLAKHQLGVRYVFGAESPSRGFDCSGFTRWVLGRLGLNLPHRAASQLRMGKRVSRRNLRPGDLVFFNNGGHVGMYIGNDTFIAASSAKGRVATTRLSTYSLPFDGARRFLKWRP